MTTKRPRALDEAIDRLGGVLRLAPQVVARFYPDANRLGQRPPGTSGSPRAKRPRFYRPERWLGSSTAAVNPPGMPGGGLSACPELAHARPVGSGGSAAAGPLLRDVLADPAPGVGPRLLGPDRFAAHAGEFRVLTKLLDAGCPIPLHVHADDAFVRGHPRAYPGQRFGKEEAYYFLDAPKGGCPYTHVGLRPGVGPRELVAAMRRGSDHVLELSPPALQRFGEGMLVPSGTLHRPGTALTLELQQPSDVATMFQTEFAGRPMPEEVLHRGFGDAEEAAEAVVKWDENRRPGLLDALRLTPVAAEGLGGPGVKAAWVFPPTASPKFSGLRLDLETATTLRFDEPALLWVWEGQGRLGERPVAGRRGAPGAGGDDDAAGDEFFLGAEALRAGIELACTGDAPLVAFVIFAATVATEAHARA